MPDVLLDPTLAYILLVVAIWLGVTSMYIPGTGITEAGALITIVGAFVWLAYLPTNWTSVILLMVGMVAFVLIPMFRPQHARWSSLALVAQGLGSLFLFNGAVPNPVVIVVMLGLAFAYNHFLLIPTMERMRDLPQVGDDAEKLMGAEGRVVGGAMPSNTGTAHIRGELWTIRSEVTLERGDIVRVIDINGLELQVERVKSKIVRPEEAQTQAAENGAVIHDERI
jgi:membrane-bound serine protease (ClpP class)